MRRSYLRVCLCTIGRRSRRYRSVCSSLYRSGAVIDFARASNGRAASNGALSLAGHAAGPEFADGTSNVQTIRAALAVRVAPKEAGKCLYHGHCDGLFTPSFYPLAPRAP